MTLVNVQSSRDIIKLHETRFIETAKQMIANGEIDVDIEFVEQFMSAYDSPEKFCININRIISPIFN